MGDGEQGEVKAVVAVDGDGNAAAPAAETTTTTTNADDDNKSKSSEELSSLVSAAEKSVGDEKEALAALDKLRGFKVRGKSRREKKTISFSF